MSTSDVTLTLAKVLPLGALHPITLLTLLFSFVFIAYYALKKPQLSLPVIQPGPGPQGVFQTLKETYERVGGPLNSQKLVKRDLTNG